MLSNNVATGMGQMAGLTPQTMSGDPSHSMSGQNKSDDCVQLSIYQLLLSNNVMLHLEDAVRLPHISSSILVSQKC